MMVALLLLGLLGPMAYLVYRAGQDLKRWAVLTWLERYHLFCGLVLLLNALTCFYIVTTKGGF